MQNKKQKEQQKSDEHKRKLTEIKVRRRGEPILERKDPSLNENPTILIYCEGKNTEPSYFNKFRLSSLTVKAFGEGRNTLSLVKRAKKLSEKDSYDEVWCVFDADPKPDNPKQLENFNAAIRLAERHKFGVAYSHQAFEYWLILHFEDHQGGAMDRVLFGDKINSYINKFGVKYDYNESKIINQDFFELLMCVDYVDRNGTQYTRTDIAIKRAENIYNRLDHRNPGKEESSTTVYKLVGNLIKYL